MKIGILTHYQADSHGALLQHYALTQHLRSMGHTVCTLTYERDFSHASDEDRKKYAVRLRSIPFYCRSYASRQGVSCIWTMGKKHLLLRQFTKRHFTLTPFHLSDLDAVIVGSDEVWSLQLGYSQMMFGHGVHTGRLIAYAPSFGQTSFADITSRCLQHPISKGLSAFSAVSVRDLHSQAVLEQLTGKTAPIVCDPAVLYPFDAEVTACPRHSGTPYIAVYAYSSNLNAPAQISAIRAYARSVGAKIYAFGSYHGWCDKQIVCDPIALLGWLRDACAVVTDTFHGTIAACLVQTPMAVYVRPTNEAKLGHLLEQLHLTARQVTEGRTLEDVFAAPLDFQSVHTLLQALRSDSGCWLCGALTQGGSTS